MSRACTIMHWQSVRDPSRRGIEIGQVFEDSQTLEAEVERLVRDLPAMPDFVLAGIEAVNASASPTGGRPTTREGRQPHICLAVDHATLITIDARTLARGIGGFLLDNVNAETPLSSISNEMLEAIRFEQQFLRLAAKSLRVRCVLDSFLRLAHDLGLATLGATSDARSGSDFDFVPASSNAP